MTRFLPRLGLTAAVSALVLSGAACSKAPSINDDLARDLERAGSTNGLELAPSANGTRVMSGIEQSSAARVAPAPSRRSVSHRPSRPEPEQPMTEAVVAPPATTPEPAAAPASIPTPRPTPRQKEPPGGWRTVGDVIRNAPFPINP